MGSALGEAAGDLAAAMLAGDTSTVLPEVLGRIESQRRYPERGQGHRRDAVTQLVGDAALWQGLGDALGGLVTTVVGDTTVQQYAGTEVAALVTAKLGGSPGRTGRSGCRCRGHRIAGHAGNRAGTGCGVASALPVFAQTGVGTALGEAAGRWRRRCSPVTPPRWCPRCWPH